jgi:lipoprotein-anchoring transpeptidase ErfK/SrfK
VLRAEILLDRAHDSPGEIDTAFGNGMAGAVAAFRHDHGLPPGRVIDADMWKLLNSGGDPVLVRYTVTAEDAAGPFVQIPWRMTAKAKLSALGYQSLLEELGERFHVSPALLRLLNPRAAFNHQGEVLIVPNVNVPPPAKASFVVVSASDHSLSVYDQDSRRLARYPATSGSRHDPLPIGTWKINGVEKTPTFHYNPDLFWDAQASDQKAIIPAGPNNPVGVVWIDLSREHYGIHGTPEPSTVGKTFSHGCIRLTNWSALELSLIVSPGTKALLQK